jgi:hypothetical protein
MCAVNIASVCDRHLREGTSRDSWRAVGAEHIMSRALLKWIA